MALDTIFHRRNGKAKETESRRSGAILDGRIQKVSENIEEIQTEVSEKNATSVEIAGKSVYMIILMKFLGWENFKTMNLSLVKLGWQMSWF